MSVLLDLVFPRTCAGCGVPGQYLCSNCQSQLIYKSIYSDSRLSMFRYHGAIKSLIKGLKFGFVTDEVGEIINLLTHGLVNRYPHLLRYWQQEGYILVPIPLHPSRQNWRGFNQSRLICQKLSAELNLRFDPNILTRIKNTVAQTTIHDRRLRRTNPQLSFLFRSELLNDAQRKSPWGIKFLNFIVFDDVYTTGSTIHSAKSVFPSGSNIWTFTIAG